MGIQQPPAYYDHIYTTSSRYINSYHTSGYWPHWAYIASIIIQASDIGIIPTRPNILDLGCGTGQFAEFLHDTFGDSISYTGEDFSPVAIDSAALRLNNSNFYRFHRKNFLNERGQKDSQHNVITILETLEHINDDEQLINELNEEKFFVFSVPSFDDPSHVRHFTTTETVYSRYTRFFKSLIIKKILDIWVCYGIRNSFRTTDTDTNNDAITQPYLETTT